MALFEGLSRLVSIWQRLGKAVNLMYSIDRDYEYGPCCVEAFYLTLCFDTSCHLQTQRPLFSHVSGLRAKKITSAKVTASLHVLVRVYTICLHSSKRSESCSQ